MEAKIEPEAPRESRSRWLFALRLASLTFVAGLLGLLIWKVVNEGRGSDLVAQIASNRKPMAPGFHLKLLWPHDETWPLSVRNALVDEKLSPRELRGHPVVINFWASWCIPCKAEAPRLVASANAHRGSVAFLGIDVQDFAGDARKFLRRFRTNYVSVRDGTASTYVAYGLTGIPETYFLDEAGRVVAHSAGEVSRRELEAGIAQATGAGS